MPRRLHNPLPGVPVPESPQCAVRLLRQEYAYYLKVTSDADLLQSDPGMAYYMKRLNFQKVAPCAALFLWIVIPRQFAAQTRKKESPKPADTIPPGWTLKFDEDFNAPSINYDKWSPHAPGKVVFEGQQSWIPGAIVISGGQAQLMVVFFVFSFSSGL